MALAGENWEDDSELQWMIPIFLSENVEDNQDENDVVDECVDIEENNFVQI